MTDMNTPIYDFVNNYSHSTALRAHMPGHKGDGSIEKYDITEIRGADSLYEADGIILESERCAGQIFGAETFYSTEGSSLSIKAMLYLTCLYAVEKGEKPLILAARNVHKSFVNAAILLDFDIEWLYGRDSSYLECKVSVSELTEHLKNAERLPTALYLTSPDYLGNIQDIKALSEVCHSFNILLLVDNAHGAYLKFLPESRHPIDLGADVSCDSAHKTLPVLTGGAYLHISKNAPRVFSERAREALALFGSTSPSYLILASLDKFNGSLPDFASFAEDCKGLKKQISSLGYTLLGDEELKITVDAKKYGYLGFELAEFFESKGVFTEFSDRDFLVLMLSPSNKQGDLEKILSVFKEITKKEEIILSLPRLVNPKRLMSPRDAAMSLAVEIPVSEAVGKTLAAVTVGCPPAVPIVVSGEVVDKEAVEVFKYYGIRTIKVVK